MSNYRNGSVIFFSQVGLIPSFAVDHLFVLVMLRQLRKIIVVAQHLILSVDKRDKEAVDKH